jgi:hypothetical protein
MSTPRFYGPWTFAPNMGWLVASELNFIFFTPGDYKISVVAEYWENEELPDGDYRTSTQAAMIRVAAPQSVILLGAVSGGFIAYLLLRVNRRQGETTDERGRATMIKRIIGEVARFIGSILLSAIITILLSRISETQFLVRVTVNDFWGAIAVGFIASWVGSRTIEKFLPEGSEDKSRATPKTRQETSNKSEVTSDFR